MATLTLTKVFINLLESGAAVSAQAARGRTHRVSQPVEVRTYGGGRRRAVTQAGVTEALGVTLRDVPAADVATLESWIGRAVLYRDDRGRKVAGVFDGMERDELVDDKGKYDISLTITATTWEEGA